MYSLNPLNILAVAINTVGEDQNLPQTIITIINNIIGVLGLVAVIVIVIGGIFYMTSTGDPNKVKKAKDTILYGVIGLIICVLSFAIVNFVISNIINSNNSNSSSQNNSNRKNLPKKKKTSYIDHRVQNDIAFFSQTL